MGMRQDLARRRLRRRRSWQLVAAVAGVAVLVVAFPLARRADRSETSAYDLAATRACLAAIATVQHVRTESGIWTYPAIAVRFPDAAAHRSWELYFAPSAAAARDSETPDSERLMRRRNVLADRPAEVEWDERILRCLRESPAAR